MNGILVVPLAYQDLTMPSWYRNAGSRKEYEAYCRWLAYHLWTTAIEPTPAQAAYIEKVRELSPDSLALEIGDAMELLLWDLADLRDKAEAGMSYAELEHEERRTWESIRDEPPWDEVPFDEFKTSEEEYRQIYAEVKEAHRVGPAPDHADIGARAILAFMVKKCVDLAEAEKAVFDFYYWFNDGASK